MNIANCHPSRKMKARGLCGACYDKALRAENKGYAERQLSNTTIWARKNPDKVRANQLRRQAKDKADPNYKINQRNKLLRRYGLTQESYLALLQKQNNCCALCYRKPSTNRFHVDHDHVTLRVRGILCHQCNWYLGVVDADPKILDRIKAYREANE